MAGKRLKAQLAKVERMKNYPLEEALKVLKGTASAKFDESVDVAINLGIDAKKSEQNVRGTAVMPRGTGKKVRVAVFAEGSAAEAAKKAGADIIGFQDLADQIKQGKIDFDLGKLGRVLGPRGLMPNPKVGTVTPNVAKAVENAKAGQVQFRTDKAGLVHCAIGKASFEADALKENFLSLMAALNKVKPAAAKGVYLKKITISTTMGPGIRLDTSGL